VERNLVRAATQYLLNVIDAAQTTADRERDVNAVGHAPHHFGHDIPAIRRGRDVQKHQFIGAFFRITQTAFDRVPGITQVHEVDAFHDPSVLYVQAWNDSLSEHWPAPPPF